MTKNNNQPTGLSYVFFFLLFYLAAPPCLFSHYYFCNFRPLLESPCIEPTDDKRAWTGGRGGHEEGEQRNKHGSFGQQC